ncbi:RNA-directed RNA polymerase [Penicillium angulare]|uniref:RNA-directed RNA polymerase n=1 Tax=Penicillium angulare TaxID=116970 RepID=UPI0025402C2F|nr:RNA-directed RNA polymerase [Penicillium angulare]KAJ5272501.1 RNA-directed RNA polymerase [Penicillium angulare]
MALLNTPQRKKSDEFAHLLYTINEDYGLELPHEKNIDWSPRAWEGIERSSLRWRCLRVLRTLFFRDKGSVYRALGDFSEWVAGRRVLPGAVSSLGSSSGSGSTRAQRGSARRTRTTRQGSVEDPDLDPPLLSDDEKDARIEYFLRVLGDQMYLLNPDGHKRISEEFTSGESERVVSPKRRRLEWDRDDYEDESEEKENESDVFHTAPNSPTTSNGSVSASAKAMPPPAKLDLGLGLDFDLDSEISLALELNGSSDRGRDRDSVKMSFMERLTQKLPSFTRSRDERSFDTVVDSVFSSHGRINESFDTDTAEPIDRQSNTQSTYADSIVELWLSEGGDDLDAALEATKQRIINDLLDKGPFSLAKILPNTIPLLQRYELERIGRAWNVPLDKMLIPGTIPSQEYTDFWTSIEGHNQRNYQAIPEKPSRRAWDAAVGDFKTERHSEAVVFTGEMSWVPLKDGLFSLKLHPPKTEKTCRFHRRFGSDRFLSLTIPDLSHPQEDVGCPSHPSLLRESVSAWLTRNDHLCIGRRWRPFFIEEVKSKSKEKREPRFRVDFFAVDGIDFCRNVSSISFVSLPGQNSDAHTRMSVNDLLEWHMPSEQNADQKNCKLFQRLSLGLSKTFVSVTVKPTQVLHLRDNSRWKQCMNDGCALMSRALAKQICEVLGITGDGNKQIPSAFQGRIAGAKGLWMVDRAQSRHQSFSDNGGDDVWIEISDSQLKIHPHPQYWSEPIDEEKLTFEVVSWSKPLRPVELNVQLLVILDHGGDVKEYIAQLAKRGLSELAEELKTVLDADNNLLCLGLMQKLKPPARSWALNDGEFVVRLSQAGFTPQTFFPLRQKLQKVFQEAIQRRVEELHIPVPLSTYAYCIADPYGVLEADEVHFAFSSNWQDPDGNFQESELMDTDVLVGRLPAHIPSDIQRRKAVYRSELRHFKDVIVFSMKGDIPLAHILSGGDYDGDTPWICWDPTLVNSFQNSNLPEKEFKPEHFGLTSHSVKMSTLRNAGDFLEKSFSFNLTTSSLGRCTVDHEKIVYDKSIDCPEALELSCLLSHLVDGRKGGFYLTEETYQELGRKRGLRYLPWPAYRESCNERRRRPKRTNIVDYIKFFVAESHSKTLLTEIESRYPANDSFKNLDQDLTRPYKEAQKCANDERSSNGNLYQALETITTCIKEVKKQWDTSKNDQTTYSLRAQHLSDTARSIDPPSNSLHSLVHTWQNSRVEWHRLLASMAYRLWPSTPFVWLAFGDVLCDLKAETLPSRSITNVSMACYKVNQKFVSQLTATELPANNMESEGFGEFTYEGEEEIEALMLGVNMGYYSGLDDKLCIQ